MSSYEQQFLRALLISVLSEGILLVGILKYLLKRYVGNIATSKIVFFAIIATTLTLPYLWFILPAFVQDRTMYLVIGEGSILIIETLIYSYGFKIKIERALLAALICNLVSYLLGFVL